MQRSNQYCQLHPQKEISCVCVLDHTCQIKLCIQCLFEHPNPYNNLYQIEHFLESLKQYKEQMKPIQKQIFIDAKKTIKNLTKKFQQFIDNFSVSLIKLVEQIENNYISIVELANIKKPFEEYSNQEIKILVKIFQCNGIDQFTALNMNNLNRLELFKNTFELSLDTLIQKQMNEFQNIEQNIQKLLFVIGQPVQKQRKCDQNSLQSTSEAIGKLNEKGQRDGFWNEILRTYSEQDHVIFSGTYEKNCRIGRWNIIHQNKVIGGGEYEGIQTQQGNFQEILQQFIQTEDTYQNSEVENVDLISKKKGHWVELYELSSKFYQITFCGEYINGKKCKNWQINFKEIKLGGGNFDENGIKQGIWTEPFNFHEASNKYVFITQIGEYQNDKKVGKWKITNFQTEIGGGYYDDQGSKNGDWVELFENYSSNAQVKYAGVYKNDQKVGIWHVIEKNQRNQTKTIQYNNQGKQHGDSIEMHKNYTDCFNIISEGSFQDGKKVGKWIISFSDKQQLNQMIEIGKGEYNYLGKKNGNWIEIDDDFRINKQLVHSGNYVNGIKGGLWTTEFNRITKKGYFQIQGSYKEGKKVGFWIELDDCFKTNNQIIYEGEYQDGLKLGNWVKKQRVHNSKEFNLVGQINDNHDVSNREKQLMQEHQNLDKQKVAKQQKKKRGKKKIDDIV